MDPSVERLIPFLGLVSLLLCMLLSGRCPLSFKRPLGWCNLKIKGQERKFNVMAIANFSLLSHNTCVALDLLQYPEYVNLLAENSVNQLLEDHAAAFEGVGCLPGEYHLEVNPDIPPVQNRPRKIPLSMKKDVKA